MAGIPPKPPLSLACAWPLQITHCFHSSQGRPHDSHVAVEETEVQIKALYPQGAPASRQWDSTVGQALTSLAWSLVLLFWPHGPSSTLIPDRDFKTPHLYFPDSQAFSSYLLPLGKNLTHHHGPVAAPSSVSSSPTPSLPSLLSPVSFPWCCTEKQQSIPPIKLLFIRDGSQLQTTDIWGQRILCCRGLSLCLVHWQNVSSTQTHHIYDES